jgi:hypothetical protein
MRNNQWLEQQLAQLWCNHFSDIQMVTPIKINFGRRAYQRLGSIVLRPAYAPTAHQHSHIVISGVLADERIPDIIVQQVIAHELVHYIHGFGSHHLRHLRHPHQGGVIVKEFRRRGLWELFRAYQAWMKVNWVSYLREIGQITGSVPMD